MSEEQFVKCYVVFGCVFLILIVMDMFGLWGNSDE
jgi:hypothetical protein